MIAWSQSAAQLKERRTASKNGKSYEAVAIASWPTGWLTDRQVGRLESGLEGKLAGWPAGGLVDGLTTWTARRQAQRRGE